MNAGLILAIDDEQDILEILKSALEGEDFEVIIAATATVGLQKFQESADRIRLVLLDYMLPDMTGDLVFECLRQIKPEARVILLTGCDDQVARRMFASGLRGYLQKPFHLDDLIEKIRAEMAAD